MDDKENLFDIEVEDMTNPEVDYSGKHSKGELIEMYPWLKGVFQGYHDGDYFCLQLNVDRHQMSIEIS